MESIGISKLDLKRRNRKQILKSIRRAGYLARVDIAAQLSLTRAAVTIITNQMVAQGILEDTNTPMKTAPDEPKRKGRKKTMIRINPTYRYVLGAIIEEEHVSVGLSNLALEPVSQETMTLTDNTDLDEIVSFIVNTAKKLVKKASLNTKQVLGLGVGIVPIRWEQMRAEKDENNRIHFSKLCYLLGMELSMPVCAANAISLYAMSNIAYTEPNGSEMLLLYGGANFNFATVTNYELVNGIYANTALVDRIVLCPDGNKIEGYPAGSVRGELAVPIIFQRMKEATGRDMAIPDINEAYIAGDEKVIEVMNDQMKKLAYLIYNLCIGHRTPRIVLQKFRLIDEQKAFLAEFFDSLCSESGALKIEYSKTSGDSEFVAGCALAAENLFYELGGLQQGEKAL